MFRAALLSTHGGTEKGGAAMAPMDGEQSRPMRTDGPEVTKRRERLGMEIYELADEAHVNRDTLSDWEAGNTKPQTRTVNKVMRTLDRLEEEMGIHAPAHHSENEEHLVRFTVKGVYGAEAIVIEGPVEDITELEGAVDRIMRRIQGRGDETTVDHP